jgi:hypothetical protein
MLLLALNTGLIGAIDHNLHLLKRDLPCHESDQILNIAFNILAGGQRIEHIKLRRNDEVFLNALGAQRIPDPLGRKNSTSSSRGHGHEYLLEALKNRDGLEREPELRRILTRLIECLENQTGAAPQPAAARH